MKGIRLVRSYMKMLKGLKFIFGSIVLLLTVTLSPKIASAQYELEAYSWNCSSGENAGCPRSGSGTISLNVLGLDGPFPTSILSVNGFYDDDGDRISIVAEREGDVCIRYAWPPQEQETFGNIELEVTLQDPNGSASPLPSRITIFGGDGGSNPDHAGVQCASRQAAGDGLAVRASYSPLAPTTLPSQTTNINFNSVVTRNGDPVAGPDIVYEWLVTSSSSGTPPEGALTSINTASPSRAFAIGEYEIQLTVTFGDESAVDTLLIEVTEGPRELTNLPGLTRNQQSMATLIDVTCQELQRLNNSDDDELSRNQQDLLNRCSGLKTSDTPVGDAVDGVIAMDGQEVSALADQARYFSSIQTSAISGRLLALRQGARGISFAGLSVFDDGGTPIPIEAITRALVQAVGGSSGNGDSRSILADSPIGVFINARYRVGKKDETLNSTGFDFDSKGLTIGVDYRLSTSFVLGLAASVGSSESDLGSAGKTESDDYALSLYGSRYGANHYLDFLFGYGTLDFDARRNISYTERRGMEDERSIEATTTGKTDGTQFWGGLSAGYDFRRGGWIFGPDLAFTYIRSEIDAFDERMLDNPETGFGLALSYGDQTVKSMTAQGGVHLSYAWSTGSAVIVPQIRAAFVKEFETDADEIYVRFVDSPFISTPGQPTPTAVIVTDKPDSSYMRWGASISAQFAGGVSGFLSYDTYSSLDTISMDDFTAGIRFQRAFR